MRKRHTFFLIAIFGPIVATAIQTVSEQLLVSPVGEKHGHQIGVFVKYEQINIIDAGEQYHSQFPPGIYQLLEIPGLESFSASLVQGEWRKGIWGETPPHTESVDTGGSLSASVSTSEWKSEVLPALSHGVSGLLCASFSSLSDADAVTEMELDDLVGRSTVAAKTGHSNTKYLFARLPLEPLCTENLAPFVKLLACRDEAGLATLLRQHMSFAKHPFKSLEIEAFRVSVDGNPKLRFRASLSAVIHTSFPMSLVLSDHQASLFNTISQQFFAHDPLGNEFRRCSATNIAKVVIVGPTSTFVGNKTSRSEEGYDTKQIQEFHYDDGKWSLNKTIGKLENNYQQLEFSSMVLHDEEYNPMTLKATYHLSLGNANPDVSVNYKYFGTLEFYMRPLLHSVMVSNEVNGTEKIHVGKEASEGVSLQWRFSQEANKKTLLIISGTLSPNSKMRLQFDFLKKFLHVGYFSFSPDRGLNLPGGLLMEQSQNQTSNPCLPAHLSVWPTNGQSCSKWSYRFTRSHYLTFALPDLSMPFNVIAMSSTAIMMFLGSIIGLTAKRPTKSGRTSLISILLAKLQRFLRHCLACST